MKDQVTSKYSKRNVYEHIFLKGFEIVIFSNLSEISFWEVDYLRSWNCFEKPCSNLTWIGFMRAFQKGLRNVFPWTVSK